MQTIDNYKYRLLNLLKTTGRAYSTREIVEELLIADPRSTIRDIRKQGVRIFDYWATDGHIRYKRYYIRNDEEQD